MFTPNFTIPSFCVSCIAYHLMFCFRSFSMSGEMAEDNGIARIFHSFMERFIFNTLIGKPFIFCFPGISLCWCWHFSGKFCDPTYQFCPRPELPSREFFVFLGGNQSDDYGGSGKAWQSNAGSVSTRTWYLFPRFFVGPKMVMRIPPDIYVCMLSVAPTKMSLSLFLTYYILFMVLDIFHRPPLHETSSLVAQIFASAPSDRLNAYQEAGCRHAYTDHTVVVKCKFSAPLSLFMVYGFF